MALSLSLHHHRYRHHVFCAQITPKTVSHTIVTIPNTKPIMHGKNLDSSVLLNLHKHNNLSKYQEEERLYMKVEQAQGMLRSASNYSAQDLVMVDAIQRLGIDYYFQDQIEAIMQRHEHDRHQVMRSHVDDDDPYRVSLGFQLLRQHGFDVSADVFDKFKDNREQFNNKELKHNIKGLMGLFEASHLSREGEDLLEEVGNLSKHILSEKLSHDLDHRQARIVRNRLDNPFHKSLARFMAKDFLHESQATNQEWSNVLRELQSLDSLMVKSIHQNEIVQVTKWWKELGLAEEVKFARDEPVKWYMWPMAMLRDPSMSALRVELTKPISLIYIIDDIFDVHATLDELTLFTHAIERWDMDALEHLPKYMKVCFKALDDTTNEISYKIHRDHGWNPVQSLRLAWGSLCKAFLVEARWFVGSGKLPKADEYLENGKVSSGVHVVLVHLFFLLGQNVTHQTTQLVNHMPTIISSTSTILRLWDDLGTAKDENQEGQDGSYLRYYMKEHPWMTTEDGREHVFDKISEAWKDLNGACMCSCPFSRLYKEGCLNLARMVPLMYNYDRNHELPILSTHMKSLLM